MDASFDPRSPQKTLCTETLHTEYDVPIFLFTVKIHSARKKWSCQAVRMIFWFCHLPKKEKKTLGSSNSKNKWRARWVSPAGKGAAEISRSLSGVFKDVSGPVWYAASYTGTMHQIEDHQFSQMDWSWTAAGSLFEGGTHTIFLSLSLSLSLSVCLLINLLIN